MPAMVCLKNAINSGGKVFTPILIPRKVVPQKKATAVKASQAMNFGCLVNGLIESCEGKGND